MFLSRFNILVQWRIQIDETAFGSLIKFHSLMSLESFIKSHFTFRLYRLCQPDFVCSRGFYEQLHIQSVSTELSFELTNVRAVPSGLITHLYSISPKVWLIAHLCRCQKLRIWALFTQSEQFKSAWKSVFFLITRESCINFPLSDILHQGIWSRII